MALYEPLGIQPHSKKVYLYRLYSLITDAGGLVYRKVFTSYATQMSGSVADHLDKYKAAIQQSFLQRRLNRTQFESLFPDGYKLNSVETCDLTLLAFLVRITCVEETADESLRNKITDLDQLSIFRNKIAHIHSTEQYDKHTFEEFWQEMKVAILQLGQDIPGLEEEIDQLKEGPIDPKREAELQEWMKDLRLRAEVAEDLIANKMSQLEVNQKTMEKKIDSNQTDIMTRFDDEAIVRKKNQDVLLNQLTQINMNPAMILPSPGDFHIEKSEYANAVQDGYSLYGEHVLEHKQKDKKTGVTVVAKLHRTVAKGTVTTFIQTDYEDFSKVIGSEWPTVAERLGLSKIQIESITAKFERSDNQVIIREMVQIWEDMVKEKATIYRFIEAVVGCLKMEDGKMSVIEGIKGRHGETE